MGENNTYTGTRWGMSYREEALLYPYTASQGSNVFLFYLTSTSSSYVNWSDDMDASTSNIQMTHSSTNSSLYMTILLPTR